LRCHYTSKERYDYSRRKKSSPLDCVERPRKVGAKFSGQDIRPDEFIQKPELDYDAKRDRWSGYVNSLSHY